MPSLKRFKKEDLKKIRKSKTKVKKSKQKIFVIHKHHATHLHWDLRLEMKGVLKSWAVPKEPPLKKNIKRLAIQVEDHDLSYANFEGIIPKGNYGAGKVEIWDKGTYELKEKTPTKFLLRLNGERLNGEYALIKTNFRDNKKTWLFMKI